MNKKIVATTSAVVLSVLLTGCGGKMVSVAKMPKQDDTMIQTININAPKALFQAETRNKANIFALQSAAEATLKNGYSYFSIDLPVGISNTKGSLANSAEKFIAECNTNSTGKELGISLFLPVSISIKDKCKISTSGGAGAIKIISYKQRPLEFGSYDAKEVLEYLKENELYIEVPNDEYVEK